MHHSTFRVIDRLGRKARAGLRRDARGSAISTAAATRRPTDTGGHSVVVGRLGRAVSVELWVDVFTSLSTPRVWFGFYSPSRVAIARTLDAAQGAQFGGGLLRRFWRDVRRRGGVLQLRRQLSTNEFDIQVLESYRGHFFLGMYSAYEWPLTGASERALVRDAVNYMSAVAGAYAATTSRSGTGAIGPWNRPDPIVERAAVRLVRERLRKSGFRVRSRESEICGYDLHATRNGEELHVEVKGVSGDIPRFFLTRTELSQAERDSDWKLAIVVAAKRRPRLMRYVSGKRLRASFELAPAQWYATPRDKTKR